MEEGDKMSYTKISDKIERVDARTKARGEAMYVCDMTLPNMLYAYMVRSTCPRGKILKSMFLIFLKDTNSSQQTIFHRKGITSFG